MGFDVGVYTAIQSTLIGSFTSILGSITAYSQDLLYLCASIEIVLFALLWAVLGNNGFGKLLFTVLKIGFLLMVINEFDSWLSLLLNTFGQIANQTDNAKTAINLISAPGDIWQYGYNSGVILLKAAAADHLSMGLSLLLTILGLGILLVFGLLGARLIITVAAFYLTALIALLFLPFGILKPTADFAYHGLHSVLKSAVALFTLLLIFALATSIWQSNSMQLTDKFTLNQILAIFFTGLVFLMMSQYLPQIAASAIGRIQPLLSDNAFNTNSAAANPALTINAPSNSMDMRAATTLDNSPSGQLNGAHFSAAVQLSPGAASQSGSLAPAMNQRNDKSERGSFDSATVVSINSATLQKLKATSHVSDN